MKKNTLNVGTGIALYLLLAVGILTLALAPVTGWACPETETRIAERAEYVEFDGVTWWARVDEFHEVAGKLFPEEKADPLPVQTAADSIMRGFLPNGIIRVTAKIHLMTVGDQMFGLTKLENAVIGIKKEYLPWVEMVVHCVFGEDAPVCGETISLCLLWAEDGYTAEQIFPSYVDHIIIGYAYFNGKREDMTNIGFGYWDGDGNPDLGLTAGFTDEPEAVPEPEPEPQQEPEPEKQPEQEKESEQEKINDNTKQTEKTDNSCGSSQGNDSGKNCESAKPAEQNCYKLQLNLNLDFLFQWCHKIFK